MMRRLVTVFLLAGLAGCGGEEAATASPGETKFNSVCKDCHGEGGQGRGIYPRLAGRSAEELAARLRQYKSGHKTDHMSDTMRPFALALSDQEIDQVAAWLASR